MRAWWLGCYILLLWSLSSESFLLGQSDSAILRNYLLPEVEVTTKDAVKPLSYEERTTYARKIRDIKKTLPYAKLITATLIETYEYTETLLEEEREAHLKRVLKEFREDMEPKMRKLTLNQGKMLIKLVHRQSGSTGYELVVAMLGGWKAWWWNAFAKLIGSNLKSRYDPIGDEEDRLTERIVRLVEQHRL